MRLASFMHLALYLPVVCDSALILDLQPIFEYLNHTAALAVCLSTSLPHQRTVVHKTVEGQIATWWL